MENPGQAKVDEYVKRIQEGESQESIFEGLPEAFRKGIEAGLKERQSVLLEEESQISEAEDQIRIEEIRERLGIVEVEEDDKKEKFPELNSMTVEEFAIWIANETKKRNIRLQEDVYEILTSRPEFRELKIKKAFGDGEPFMSVYHSLSDKIIFFKNDTEKNMSQVDGSEYVTGKWDHYRINDDKRESEKTFKGYITIDKDQVLDKFSTDIRKGIVKKLVESGYKGQVKFPVLGSRVLFAYDNIVLHGVDSDNVEKGLKIVQDFLQEQNIDFEKPRYGVDSKDEKGEKKSYTQRVAELVEDYIKNPDFNLDEEIGKLKE